MSGQFRSWSVHNGGKDKGRGQGQRSEPRRPHRVGRGQKSEVGMEGQGSEKNMAYRS